MRVVLQRVTQANVTVDGRVVGSIGPGLLVLAGAAADDTTEDFDWLARKIAQLRVFGDDDGVMNRSVVDVGSDVDARGGIRTGSILVEQMTLAGECRAAGRASRTSAWPPSSRNRI